MSYRRSEEPHTLAAGLVMPRPALSVPAETTAVKELADKVRAWIDEIPDGDEARAALDALVALARDDESPISSLEASLKAREEARLEALSHVASVIENLDECPSRLIDAHRILATGMTDEARAALCERCGGDPAVGRHGDEWCGPPKDES